MGDRPIIFSAPMVRALLDGRKTQTRLVLKEQPPEWATFCQQPSMYNALHQWVPSGLWRWSEPEQSPARPLRQWPIDEDGSHYWLSPPYAARDRLWVREAHILLPRTAYRGSIGTGTIEQREHPTDGYTAAVFREGFDRSGRKQWRSSTQMPRWASRLTLAVTDVRVERLQDISEDDAIAEGASQYASSTKLYRAFEPEKKGWYRHGFLALWDHLHGPESTDANPWVAAISFTVHRANIDALLSSEAAA